MGMNKTNEMTQNNPYRAQMIAQGRDPIDRPVKAVPARYAAPPRPCCAATASRFISLKALASHLGWP